MKNFVPKPWDWEWEWKTVFPAQDGKELTKELGEKLGMGIPVHACMEISHHINMEISHNINMEISSAPMIGEISCASRSKHCVTGWRLAKYLWLYHCWVICFDSGNENYSESFIDSRYLFSNNYFTDTIMYVWTYFAYITCRTQLTARLKVLPYK